MASINFSGNEMLKAAGVQIEYTPEQIEEYQKCMNDPIYFARNYVTIVNLDKGRMMFDMYPFQEKMVKQFQKERFNICKLHRQCGKCVFSSTKIRKKKKKTGKIEDISIQNFKKHIKLSQKFLGNTTYCLGNIENHNNNNNQQNKQKQLSDTIIRKFIESYDTNDYQIWTDTGWEDVSAIHKTVEYEVYILTLENGLELKCADDHIVFTDTMKEVFVKNLVHGDYVMTENGPVMVESIVRTGEYENMYDVTVDSGNHRFYSNGILSHNTTTTVSYMLWLTLFHDDKKVAVLANKGQLARDILSNYQTAYESLPMWLQQGVRVWNKGRITLENGSSITAAATSSSAIRGSSFNCVTGETSITIKNDGSKETTVPISEIEYESGMKVYTPSGFQYFDGVKISIKEQTIYTITLENGFKIRCTPEHRFLITDPRSSDFQYAKELEVGQYVFHNESNRKITSITKETSTEPVYDLLNVHGGHMYFTNGFVSHNCVVLDEFAFVSNNIADDFMASVLPTISSSEEAQIIIISTPKGMNHFYKLWTDAKNKKNAYVPFEAHWSEVPGRDQKWAEQQLKLLGQVKYEQEVECRFLGSSDTLLDGRTLQNMKYLDPVARKEILNGQYLDIYEKPIRGGEGRLDVQTGMVIKDDVYIVSVDVAEGLGMDYSAITVIDVTMLPYKVVATFKSNTIPPITFPSLIVQVAKYYNNAYIIMEINQQPQVAEMVATEFNYPNIIKVQATGNGLNQFMVLEGNGKNIRNGLKTSHTTKRMGCNALKDLIESGKLLQYDFGLYKEFTTFIRIKNSWGADDGEHDDLVSCLVLFGWCTTQEAFNEITNHNLRKIREKEMGFIEDDGEVKVSVPLPQKLDSKYIVEDGCLWEIVSSPEQLYGHSTYEGFTQAFYI